MKQSTFFSYSFNNTNLKKSVSERDQVITVNSNLHRTNHVSKIVRKVESVLAALSKIFPRRSPATYLKLYMTMVKFTSLVWKHCLAQYINLMERVQKRTTIRITAVKHLPYIEYLTSLGMDTLKVRPRQLTWQTPT